MEGIWQRRCPIRRVASEPNRTMWALGRRFKRCSKLGHGALELYLGNRFYLDQTTPTPAIDLDDCLDSNGIAKPWASAVLDPFITCYCEISLSNRGESCFVTAALPRPRQSRAMAYRHGRIKAWLVLNPGARGVGRALLRGQL
jgi:hypothetical protein